MLLKVLREEAPRTNQGTGRPYTAEELDYFWGRARHLPIALEPALRSKLEGRQADVRLWQGGPRLGGPPTGLHDYRPAPGQRHLLQQPQLHLPGTGRRRGHPGTLAGLAGWPQDRQLRARPGRRRVAPHDGRVGERVAEIEELMRRGMREVMPGMNVKVETVVTGSLNKGDRIEDDRIGRETPLAMSRATMRSGPSHSRIETMAAA